VHRPPRSIAKRETTDRERRYFDIQANRCAPVETSGIDRLMPIAVAWQGGFARPNYGSGRRQVRNGWNADLHVRARQRDRLVGQIASQWATALS
jgi:hypothetical protein